MHDLTGFQRDILYIVVGLNENDSKISRELPHGLAIRDHLSEYYEQEINHGRLYPNIDSLVHKGLLKKHELDQRTNGYTLTDRGKREIVSREKWEGERVLHLLEDERATPEP